MLHNRFIEARFRLRIHIHNESFICSYIIATYMAAKKTAEQPIRIEMLGYEVVEKVAMTSGNSSRIYLPVDWKGKRVRAVRVDP